MRTDGKYAACERECGLVGRAQSRQLADRFPAPSLVGVVVRTRASESWAG